jgi:hypothetical protein
MYIVYDTNHNELNLLRSKYLVLELDTLEFLDGKVMTAHAVVDSEHIPLQEVNLIENLRDLHTNLIKNYHLRNWDYCKQAIDHLTGKFRGELDTFYSEMFERIEVLEQANLAEDWTGNIILTEETI